MTHHLLVVLLSLKFAPANRNEIVGHMEKLNNVYVANLKWTNINGSLIPSSSPHRFHTKKSAYLLRTFKLLF